MISVTQRRVGRPMGQCTEATIASILEVGLDDVPDLWGGPDCTDEDQRPLWRFTQMCGFIVGRGFQLVRYNLHRKWNSAVEIDALEPPRHHRLVARGYHMLCGENPDGIGHATVGRDGRPAWGTNPTRRGLAFANEIGLLVPLEMVEDEWLGWLMRDYKWRDGQWVLTRYDWTEGD